MLRRNASCSCRIALVLLVALPGLVARAAVLSSEMIAAPAVTSLPVSGLLSSRPLAAGPTASPNVPSYSSLPEAPCTLYLNFDGINYPGTWGGYTPGNVPAYDVDGDSSTFSSTELANIHEIWARVAEAYSPFNVNITTVAPGSTPIGGEWSQIVIAAENTSGTDWYGVAGGVAYVNGFYSGGQQYGTGWAFTNHLYVGNAGAPNAPKYIAIAAAHEAGHQFGLSHQRQYDSSGYLLAEYRPSTDGNLTAPIMGLGYYSVRALWSNGPSNSATSHQYDADILAGNLGYRPDDDNNDIAHAKPLTVTNGVSISASGVIKDPTENDLFSFTTGAGQVTLNVLHNAYGGMLDAKLLLYRQDGTLLQTIDPALTSTGPDYGLDATFSGYLSAGTYYLGVASHGEYGDLGQYTLTGAITAVPEPSALAMLLGMALLPLACHARKRLSRSN